MKNHFLNYYTKIKIILFGYFVGLKALIHGDYKIALKRIILPVNYWRVSVFSNVIYLIKKWGLKNREKIEILDIGSPKLLALYLGKHFNTNIVSTDLKDKAIFNEWKNYYHYIKKEDNIFFEYANAKQLKYPDKSFDIVYIISVLHMITPSENGDILALKEILPKIKKNGLLIIEVPYRRKYIENYISRNNFEEKYIGMPLFKERQYDLKSLNKRIFKNVSGDLIELIFLYEIIPFDSILRKFPNFLRIFSAFLEPYIDLLNIKIAKGIKHLNKTKSIILLFKIKE